MRQLCTREWLRPKTHDSNKSSVTTSGHLVSYIGTRQYAELEIGLTDCYRGVTFDFSANTQEAAKVQAKALSDLIETLTGALEWLQEATPKLPSEAGIEAIHKGGKQDANPSN